MTMPLMRFIKSLGGPKSSNGIDLYLHIGMPKTGTTAIQNFLACNRRLLRQRFGVLYPECGVPESQHTALVKSMVDDKYAWTHFNEAIDAFDPDRYIEDVLDQCRQHRCHTVLLSSEFFWGAPVTESTLPFHTADRVNFEYIDNFIADCRALLGRFERTRIVVYLRRQDLWIDSFFNQQLKDGFDIPDADELLVLKNYLLYHENLRMWAKHFGRENIIVRIYRENGTWDVLSDIVSVLSLKYRSFRKPPMDKRFSNPRLSTPSAKIMQLAINLQLDTHVLKLLKTALQEMPVHDVTTSGSYPQGLFDSVFCEQIRRQYRSDNAKLATWFPETRSLLVAEPAVSKSIPADRLSEPGFQGNDTEALIFSLLQMIRDLRVRQGK